MTDSWSEQFRLAGEDWVDKDAAASLLEETKSAFMSQKMLALGGIAVSRAEMEVKGSPEWEEYIEKMVQARHAANLAKVRLEWIKMRYHEQQSHEATARSERRM